MYTLVPDPRLVLDAPFVYQAQRRFATQLLTVPVELFERREQFENPAPVFVFSIGRCGSTLLSSLLRSAGRRSVSEPDVLTQLAVMPEPVRRHVGAGVVQAIIRGTVASLARQCDRNAFLKLRSACNALWADLLTAVPDARAVFVLRERRSWARSSHRAFGSSPQGLAATLHGAIQALDQMRRAGVRRELVWYDELASDPLSVLRRLGVEADGRGALDAAALRRTLDQDSQADTGISRDDVRARDSEERCLSAFEALWDRADSRDLVSANDLGKLML
ncbi:MAG: hypothetical protein P4L83_02750 [Nevskia sp.]|nr:hypothetical protein [Nevskia sp.]